MRPQTKLLCRCLAPDAGRPKSFTGKPIASARTVHTLLEAQLSARAVCRSPVRRCCPEVNGLTLFVHVRRCTDRPVEGITCACEIREDGAAGTGHRAGQRVARAGFDRSWTVVATFDLTLQAAL